MQGMAVMLVNSWINLPSQVATAPVLVAVADANLRIDVAAALVCGGRRIVLARSGAQLSALLPSVEIVIAEPQLLAAVRPRVRPVLERVRVLMIHEASDVDAVVSAALRMAV